MCLFFFSSRRRHTRSLRDWSSDVCSSDLLVYDDACPNVAQARSNLLAAFALLGLPPSWCEHRIGDPSAPVHTRGYGSPTRSEERRVGKEGRHRGSPCR